MEAEADVVSNTRARQKEGQRKKTEAICTCLKRRIQGLVQGVLLLDSSLGSETDLSARSSSRWECRSRSSDLQQQKGLLLEGCCLRALTRADDGWSTVNRQTNTPAFRP